MFDEDSNKLQQEALRIPAEQPSDVIVSPDTHRGNRIPPGQSRTKKWPVLDAGGPPRLDKSKWALQVEGLVENPITWNWQQFLDLPRIKVFSDFHCVTRWSRLGNLWEGVSTREIARLVRPKPLAKYVLLHGYDYGWTTNVPLEEFLAEDALVATHHDGEPLSLEHGAPARVIIPRLYAWKSAKWVGAIQFIENDKPGFWERNGYHMHGDPWREERFGY